MANKIKVRVYETNKSMNYGSGGFKYSNRKAIIIGNNDKLSENLLIHGCMKGHGEYAYGDLESMECRDQDGGHSYYKLNDITYTFTEWEEIDDVYIHIFTTEGTIVCIPKDLING